MIESCNDTSTVRYREYIVINGTQVDIKGEFSETAYKDTTFFGTFCLKMLKFEASNEINYQKKEFAYYKQVNDTPIKIGSFIVTEVSDVDTYENVTVTAYDYGLKFANLYTTSLDYSSNTITMFAMVQEICTKMGVQLENSSLPNGSFIVDTNQFVNDEQYGDVVSRIALLNGMFAHINENDKLEFVFTKNSDEIALLNTEDSNAIITEDDDNIVANVRDTIENYEELEDKRNTKPITCVLIAPSEELESAGVTRKDTALVQRFGENWLKIYDYTFAYSTAKCNQLITAIFNQIKGFGYTSFEAKGTFKPYYKLGQLINYKTKDGTIRNSIVLRINSEYEDVTISAPSITDASVSYIQPESQSTAIKNAELSINKANAEIVLKINSDGNVAQVGLGTNADSGTDVNIKADNINFEGKTFNLTAEEIQIQSTNFSVDEDGVLEATNANVSGTITSSNGNIGGWIVNQNGLTNNAVKINSDGSSTIYTVADLVIIRNYIMGTTGFDLRGSVLLHYDFNGDGVVDATDYQTLKNLIGLDFN